MYNANIKIINLNNVNLVNLEDAVTVDGIYNAIEGTKDAILLTGLKVDGVEMHNRFLNIYVNGSDFVAEIGNGLEIVIDDENGVKVQSIA